jgi:hypothetical protein
VCVGDTASVASISNVATDAVRWPINPTLILDGLSRIHDETLAGLTSSITFRPGQKGHPSNGCVFHEFLTTTGWTPDDSRPICRPR